MIKGLGICRIGRHSKLFNFSIQHFILKNNETIRASTWQGEASEGMN